MKEETLLDTTNESVGFLSLDDNSTTTIILVEKACEQYQKTYNKLDVPYSYIKFFVAEFEKYSPIFKNKLKEFYNGCKKYKVTSEDLVDRYTRSFYSQHNNIKVIRQEKFLTFPTFIQPSFANEMRNVTNTNISEMVENIINICKKIDHQDELVGLVELYERFMIEEFIKNYDFKSKDKKKSKKQPKVIEVPIPTPTANKTETLVGSQLDDNYQSGKITKIIIPKLKLPTNYPINLEKSRIETSKKVKSFCTPAKQIVFINRKKIVGIKYSSNFIEKRKNIKPARKKFDWDF